MNSMQKILGIVGTGASIVGLGYAFLSFNPTQQPEQNNSSGKQVLVGGDYHDYGNQDKKETEAKHEIVSPAITAFEDVIIMYSGVDKNEVDIVVKALKEANIVFNSPSVMQKNSVEAVALILSVRESVQDLLKAVEGEEKEPAVVKYSNRMKAKLISENSKSFEIVEISPPLQAVGTMAPVRWRWNVTPLESGIQSLHLTLTALIIINGAETDLLVQTFHKEIQVNVTASDEFLHFLANNWQWLLGTLIFPLIVWYLKARESSRAD